MERWQAVMEFTIDLVYPRRCGGCRRRGTWLCIDCDAALTRFATPWCARCGVPMTYDTCRCASMPAGLDAVRSVGPYAGWLRGAITECKYHGEWARSALLGTLIAGVAAELAPFDALVPVPLHRARLRHRGFNQSRMLADHAANRLSVPVEDLLVRSRRTEAQARLGAQDRVQNVKDAFVVIAGPGIAGRSLILIDDVITTGATLSACADALRHAGASSVSAVTVAREL